MDTPEHPITVELVTQGFRDAANHVESGSIYKATNVFRWGGYASLALAAGLAALSTKITSKSGKIATLGGAAVSGIGGAGLLWAVHTMDNAAPAMICELKRFANDVETNPELRQAFADFLEKEQSTVLKSPSPEALLSEDKLQTFLQYHGYFPEEALSQGSSWCDKLTTESQQPTPPAR